MMLTVQRWGLNWFDTRRSEEVWHGDITVGVKHVWNVITAEKYSFYHLRSILLPLLIEVCTGAGPVDALKVQSSNSNTKVSRVQVQHQVRGQPGALVFAWLVGRCTFVPKNIKTVVCFNRALTDYRFFYGKFVLKEEGLFRIMWSYHTSSAGRRICLFKLQVNLIIKAEKHHFSLLSWLQKCTSLKHTIIFWIPESIIETTLLLSRWILLWIKAGFSFYHSKSTSIPFQNFTYRYTWPTSLLFKCTSQIETVWEMDIIISFKDGRRQRRVIDHWCFRP